MCKFITGSFHERKGVFLLEREAVFHIKLNIKMLSKRGRENEIMFLLGGGLGC